jgi:hypothetical protein
MDDIYKIYPARTPDVVPFTIGGPSIFHLGASLTLETATNQLYCNHEAEKSLLLLIYTVGGVSKFMLERAISPQKRWDKSGLEYQIEPQNAGFGIQLRRLFSENGTLWQVLERLISIGVIGTEKSDGMETYIYGWEPAQSLYGQRKSKWIEQILRFFCYIFPRNPTAL